MTTSFPEMQSENRNYSHYCALCPGPTHKVLHFVPLPKGQRSLHGHFISKAKENTVWLP